MADEPMLLRVPGETRDVLAGDVLVDELADVIAGAMLLPRPPAVVTRQAAVLAARRVLGRLVARCAVEELPNLDRSPALALIAGERLRHLRKGYGAVHDDGQHPDGELTRMAIWYADDELSAMDWPGDLVGPSLPRRQGQVGDLVRAGSLLAAAIDQLGRKGWPL
ncbi:hypothetical protein ACN27G_06140 [Plantactinospora sp. WMMB334]|uniref:hypothetical protein n=1 Tax=Plantactinospora sp. WMMB334 TaxID=3404119 RepID=UPI003B930EB6